MAKYEYGAGVTPAGPASRNPRPVEPCQGEVKGRSGAAPPLIYTGKDDDMTKTDLEYTFPRNWVQSKRAEQAQTRRDAALAENAAAERRGYMLAVAKLHALSENPQAPLSDKQRDGVAWAAVDLEGWAPGEAER